MKSDEGEFVRRDMLESRIDPEIVKPANFKYWDRKALKHLYDAAVSDTPDGQPRSECVKMQMCNKTHKGRRFES